MSPNRKTKKLDMLNGPIWNKLPQYAIPVAATGILEQLFNASDLSIVGNFASTDRTVAIAAVGANSSVIGVILNLFIGLSLGSNVVIANAIGRGDKKQVEQAVHTSVVASFLGGLLVALLGELCVENLFQLLHIPDEVMPYALLYIRIYLLGLPVIFLYNVKSANPTRMKENLDIFDFELNEKEMKAIASLDTGPSCFGERKTAEQVKGFLDIAQTYQV